jgi:hypothetical protein
MQRRFRALAGWAARVWAAWALPVVGSAFAQVPPAETAWRNPIASSNSMAVAPARPAPAPTAAPAEATGAVTGPATITTYISPAGRTVVPARTIQAPPPPAGPPSVPWVSANRRPVATLPEPDRPMMTCEPVPPAPPAPAPVAKVPAPSAPPPPLTAASNPPTPRPQPRPLGCRFTDGKPAPKDDSVFFAAVRGAWGTPAKGVSAEALRTTVEAICRAAAAEVRAEVVGDRQVKVTLAVRNLPDWQRLYARLQALPELGDRGNLFQVRGRP